MLKSSDNIGMQIEALTQELNINFHCAVLMYSCIYQAWPTNRSTALTRSVATQFIYICAIEAAKYMLEKLETFIDIYNTIHI